MVAMVAAVAGHEGIPQLRIDNAATVDIEDHRLLPGGVHVIFGSGGFFCWGGSLLSRGLGGFGRRLLLGRGGCFFLGRRSFFGRCSRLLGRARGQDQRRDHEDANQPSKSCLVHTVLPYV